MVEQFERDFAAFCDAEHCVGVSNGTDALRFALIAAGIKPGDTVVTVPNTFIATTEAISQAGARPDFVDIDERTYNMDPEKLREYLEVQCYFDDGKLKNRKTGLPVTAVVPVHLYGQTADMDPILELAERYNLIVIEDACQAHGAEYFSKKDESLEEGRLDGRGGSVQLLSWEEPRRLWRGRRRHHQRRGNGAEDAHAARSRPKSRSIITRWKGTTDGWMRSKPGS